MRFTLRAVNGDIFSVKRGQICRTKWQINNFCSYFCRHQKQNESINSKHKMNMKKLSNYFVYAVCFIAVALSTGAFIKVNAKTNNMPAGQPVDLTYAADKALPAVVHIKYLQNSKIQTVEMDPGPWGFDPFEFFFAPFGQLAAGYRRHQCGRYLIISAGIPTLRQFDAHAGAVIGKHRSVLVVNTAGNFSLFLL